MKKISNKSKKITHSSYPRNDDDIFINRKMLNISKDEIKEYIHSLLSEIKSDIAQIKEQSHRIELKVEDQNNKNKIVLDALSSLFDRQERIEAEFKK